MAKGICVCFISLFLLIPGKAAAQDTIIVPLHIRAGFDIAGLALKAIDNNLISYGIQGSLDLNESLSTVAGARYSSFAANDSLIYNYKSRGLNFVVGTDYNFLKPKVAAGKHYAGIGIRYGISFYGQEASRIEYTNIWGTGTTTLPLAHYVGNYVELTPGVRTELFPGVTIGWNLYVRLLLGAGTGPHLKPVYMPGYGDASSPIATGAAYYISITIPYRKITVITKPKAVTTDEETEGEIENEGEGTDVSGTSF